VQSPESNDHILPVHNLARVSSLDFDMSDGGIMYWSDLNDKKKSPKSISRAFLNGTNVEVIIEFGLESPDSIAVDWVANNIYWSDSILKRIQVSKSDGTSKRVILWKNLGIPTTIVLDPASGHIYWSTSGESAVIERANLDGTSRKIIVSSENIGRPSALAIDYDLKRLYWTDTEKQAISYVSLSKVQKQEIKTILHTASSQLQSLTLYNDNVYWTELDNKLIKRGNKYGGQIRGQVGGQITFQDKSTEVIDLFVYHKSRQKGTNNCAVNNGGCSELCLYVGNGVHKCACPSHHFLSEDNERCIEPEEFLLFGQKNKISRLLLDEAHPDEVHDLVLPVRGARDIRSLDYDPQSRLIYWIDHGSKKKSEHPPRVSIKRAFDNGTLHPEKRLHYSREIRSLIPYDLKVDWNSRLLFWTCERTNSINVTRLDYLEDSDYDEEFEEEEDGENNRIDNPAYIVGSILTGGEDKPRSITVHPYKR
jgi:low density lipoprotein receptor-related protein 5/6